MQILIINLSLFCHFKKFVKLASKFPNFDLSLNEFMNEVFKQFNTATLSLVSQTISVIHQSDEAILSKPVMLPFTCLSNK